MDSSSAERCRCGHGREAHLHHRGGTDCALCDACPRFRPAHPLRSAVARLVRAWPGRRAG